MAEIRFSRVAAKELERIYRADKKLYRRLLNAIKSLANDPRQGKQLKGPLADDYSLRIGTYRIIYALQNNALLITIIDIGHRKEIYR